MTKLEQIEKLREKANVSYDEARNAFDAADGDLLDAIIYLEKQGKVEPPNGGGHFSSTRADGCDGETGSRDGEQHSTSKEAFSEGLEKIGKFAMRVIHKGNTSTFEVLKGTESKIEFPLTVLALLLIFLPWVTIPLVVIGFALGYRYRFHGIDLGDVG